MGPGGEENPALMAELRALRQRKGELESHLAALQDSRRQLMVQLEGLMKLLKVSHKLFYSIKTSNYYNLHILHFQNHQASPRSTPNSSPRSTKSPPLPSGSGSLGAGLIGPGSSSSRSAPPTPGSIPTPSSSSSASSVVVAPSSMNMPLSSQPTPQSSLPPSGAADSLAGDVRSAFAAQQQRSLRNDLLVAADSVTCAMSTLVRELNSGTDEEALDPPCQPTNLPRPQTIPSSSQQ